MNENGLADQQTNHYRDVSEFVIGPVRGLFEIVERGSSKSAQVQLFLLMAESGVYFAKFALQGQRLEMVAAPGVRASAEEIQRRENVHNAKFEVVVSCGLAAITTLGSFAAGIPTGGLAWTLTFAQGAVSWTECGLSVDKHRKLSAGQTPWVESSAGRVVNLVVTGTDWLLVTRELGHAVALGVGKRTIAGLSNDMAPPLAWTRAVIVQLPEFVLRTDNLLDAGRAIGSRSELLAEMTKHVLKHTADEFVKHVKLPIYGNWCGPGHGGGAPIDIVDGTCMIHDHCYADRGYFDCECDAELIQRLEAIAGATLGWKARTARWSVLNWFKFQSRFCRDHRPGVPNQVH
jgi:Phospholipase A2